MEKNERGAAAVKSENRRALPKYLLILLASLLVGAAGGFLIGMAGDAGLPETVTAALNAVLTDVTPWGIPVSSLLLLGAAFWNYRTAGRQYKSWDGEDEDLIDRVEQHLSWVLLLVSLQMVLDFFFFAASVIYMRGIWMLAEVGLFILSIAAVIVFQQKVVDLEKAINPEKRGSVYDTKFQKKWLESCDEAEQKQIGQAAHRAFAVTTNVCLVLWVVLVLLSMVFDISLLPAFLVLLVLGVMQMSYMLACMKMNRRRD